MKTARSNGKPKQQILEWPRGQFNAKILWEEGAQGLEPFGGTDLGVLFKADCLDVLPTLREACVDTVFADPPFNLGKEYGESFVDRFGSDGAYLNWCYAWLQECVRVLKPGGSLFVYNLPKWNIPIGAFLLEQGMQFRHWIAVEISACLPISGRLHPSHYSLLYFSKGKPNTFRKIRTPIQLCRHCEGEVKDYGGHRKALNEKGLNLKDVWSDIPPVRHAKFKSGERKANALSTKMLDRVIEVSTVPGDLVLDPFGGSGTTFAVCEVKGRRWVGVEIDYADIIMKRLMSSDLQHHRNDDYVEH